MACPSSSTALCFPKVLQDHIPTASRPVALRAEVSPLRWRKEIQWGGLARKRYNICIGLRYRKRFVPRDDGFAGRCPDFVVVAEVVVECRVGHHASAWFAQQVRILWQVEDDVRNFRLRRLLHCQRVKNRVRIKDAAAATLPTCLVLCRVTRTDSPRGRRRGDVKRCALSWNAYVDCPARHSTTALLAPLHSLSTRLWLHRSDVARYIILKEETDSRGKRKGLLQVQCH
jgi:hypothetical protein